MIIEHDSINTVSIFEATHIVRVTAHGGDARATDVAWASCLGVVLPADRPTEKQISGHGKTPLKQKQKMKYSEKHRDEAIEILTPELCTRIANGTRRSLEDRQDIQFAFLYGSFVELTVFHDIDLGITFHSGSL